MLFKNTNISEDVLSHAYLPPKKITIKDGTENTGAILRGGNFTAVQNSKSVCKLDTGATLLVDFGEEISGGARLVFHKNEGAKIRLSFGETAAEALFSDGENTAPQSTVLTVRSYSTLEYGSFGFRFLCISPIDAPICISGLFARADFRKLPWLGTFESSDRRLNEIWRISARTIHLNMQERLFSGIKQARHISLGDLYTEARCTLALFGETDCLKDSLDFVKSTTPKNAWINNCPSHSLLWVMIQYELYMHSGDLEYLNSNMDTTLDILARFAKCISGDGSIIGLDKFIDKSIDSNASAKDAAFGALAALAFERGAYLCRAIEKEEFTAVAQRLEIYAKRLHRHEAWSVNKQAVAMQLISGQKKPEDAVGALTKDTAQSISVFWGYATLTALAKCGAHKEAVNVIKKYWGAMLELGATSFFESFNLTDTEGALPPLKIDTPPTQEAKNIYQGGRGSPDGEYALSLCHGMASSPLLWISEHILGVKILEPGCKKLSVKPKLLGLSYIKGAYPTPFGTVEISVTKTDGEPLVEITAPEGVEIVVEEKSATPEQ